MKKIFILLIVLLGLLVIGCGKKWDYQVTKKESIQIGNDITFYLLTLKEKESGNEIESLQITKEAFDKYNIEDKLTKEELDSIKISKTCILIEMVEMTRVELVSEIITTISFYKFSLLLNFVIITPVNRAN